MKSDSTKPFSIRVRNLPTKFVTLSWTPPTQNTDGSPLEDLAGYNIYFGRKEGEYPERIVISDPTVSAYVVGGLTSGTYYFVSTAYNSQGIESDFSNVAVQDRPVANLFPVAV